MNTYTIDGKKVTQKQWYDHLEKMYAKQMPYAELGRLAIEAMDIHADNAGCVGIMNENCPTDRRKCAWYKFCQKRAELLGEAE